MNGHRQVTESRRAGYKPSTVFLEVGLTPPVVRSRFDEPELAMSFNLYPTVFLEAWEASAVIDWRFLVGCRVSMAAPLLSDAVVQLIERMAADGAAEIFACGLDNGEILIFSRGEWHADLAAG